MGLLDIFKSRAKRAADADRMLDYGIFLVRLKKKMELLKVPNESPLPFRICAFLIFGADVIREEAGFAQIDEHTDIRESAALVLVVQQGIHTLLTLQPNYRDEFAKIYAYATAKIFKFDLADPGNRGLGILGFSTTVVKRAQSDNVPLLQSIFDGWDHFFESNDPGALADA